MKRTVSLIVLVASVLCVQAQVSVEAEIDFIQIFVGQQAHVTLAATAKEDAKVEFPQWKPTEYVTPGVEVLDCKELENKEEDKSARYLRREFSYSKFEQTLLLPDDVKREDIKARVEHGVLTVELPKQIEEKAKVSRQIEIG